MAQRTGPADRADGQAARVRITTSRSAGTTPSICWLPSCAALDSPDEALFYTSGRLSNEAAFLLQLFARAFGTNNLPDCSNMCHESSGAGLNETLGVGKGSVSLDDLHEADLVLAVGLNPGTNMPRMLSALEETKRNGGHVIAVNPLPEAGLIRFKNPQKVSGILGRGTPIADQFLHIKPCGDLALFQAHQRRCC